MELVSNKTRSSLDGPFHESFRKFLVNGKRPITFLIKISELCIVWLLGNSKENLRFISVVFESIAEISRSQQPINQQNKLLQHLHTTSLQVSNPRRGQVGLVCPFSSDSRVFVACCLFFLLICFTCGTIRRKHTHSTEQRTFHQLNLFLSSPCTAFSQAFSVNSLR